MIELHDILLFLLKTNKEAEDETTTLYNLVETQTE